MKTTTGQLIAFDGPNGCGKSTVVAAIADALQQGGAKIYKTSEPTNSELGRLIRKGEEHYCNLALAYLIAADRLWHVQSEIAPALSTGHIVLSDRYIASSLALQALDGISLDLIWNLNCHCIPPFINIILTATPDTLEERLSARKTLSRFERTFTRMEEIVAFDRAHDFLRAKCYNSHVVNNEAALDTVVAEVCGLINMRMKDL